jgi:hypothetical protein
MRSNRNALKLIELGLSSKTVSKLTESQINVLIDKLIKEQNQTKEIVTKVRPGGTESKKQSVPPNSEIEVSTTGTTITTPIKEIGEISKGEKNPYAICTSKLGKEFGTTKRSEWTKSQEKKYERCKADIKKSLTEGKNHVSLFLEQKIQQIVEKHIPPKMTKKEIMSYILESPSTAPAEPTTKPGTKPTTKPGTRPGRPGQNPFPKEHPAPKANKPSPEEAKEIVIDLIMNLIRK